MFQTRLDRLRELAARGNLDGVALVPGPSLTYLTGVHYHLSQDRPLVLFVPVEGAVSVIIPNLERDRLNDALPFPIDFFTYGDTEGCNPAFAAACKPLAGKKIGVDGLLMRVAESRLIEQYAPGSTVAPADDVLIDYRLRKTADEVAAMRRAIQISEAALESILGQIHVGMTERQILRLLTSALTDQGGMGESFSPIVLSGPNSALPHGEPSDRALQSGDLLLFDYGATFGGYPADITRTFAIGALDAELTRVYETVLAANAAGLRAGKPGIAAQEVDRAARAVIDGAGLGPYFTHRTGHGLGVDIHEAPYMREGNTQLLEPGMIYTVEPGIYLPGRGGVRIEDNVLVTETGCESLTSFPKTLRILG